MNEAAILGILAAIAWAHALPASALAVQPLDVPFLVVTDYVTGLWRINPTTGAIIDRLAVANSAGEMAVGPDGALYVGQFESRRISKYDPQTGALLQTFPLPGKPRGIAFGPDGHLYISDTANGDGGGQVRRLDPATGQLTSLITTFSPSFSSPVGLAFGPGAELYVALSFDRVNRYDPKTGAFLSTFCKEGVDRPQSILFRPDGRLLVANQRSGNIAEYSPAGEYLGVFASHANNPQGMLFLPDGDLIAGSGFPWINRFDGETGALLGRFTEGLIFTSYVVMIPEPVGAAGLILALFLVNNQSACRLRIKPRSTVRRIG